MMDMRFTRKFAVMLILAGLPALSVHAQTWDANQQFSTTQNPSGPWSYGWSTTLTGPITPYPNYTTQPGESQLEEWQDDSIVQNQCPHVNRYTSTAPYSYVPPLSMLIQAGPQNQFS